jgi:tetratricopeptide (TPR) repeat protein
MPTRPMKVKRLAVVFILFASANVGASTGASAGATASRKQEEGIEAGRRAYEASDYSRAAQLLQDAVAKSPQNSEIYLLLTKTYYETQQHDAAIASAEKAVVLEPENSVYHEWLGRAYGGKAEHAGMFSGLSLAKKTRKEFETAVRLDGMNFSARQALIEYDCSAPGIAGGGEDKARPQIARLAELDAAEGHYATGNCRRQKKDFATADAEFTKALDNHPKSADLIYDIGDYAMKHSQPERLISVANEGEKAAPTDPRGDFYRAVALILTKNDSGDAESLLREYLKRAPNRSGYPRPWEAHEWLGRLYEKQGETQAAISEYEAALKLDPKSKNASEGLKRLKKD